MKVLEEKVSLQDPSVVRTWHGPGPSIRAACRLLNLIHLRGLKGERAGPPRVPTRRPPPPQSTFLPAGLLFFSTSALSRFHRWILRGSRPGGTCTSYYDQGQAGCARAVLRLSAWHGMRATRGGAARRRPTTANEASCTRRATSAAYDYISHRGCAGALCCAMRVRCVLLYIM